MQKKEFHLTFNMENDRQRSAYEMICSRSGTRSRSSFVIDAVIALGDKEELAEMMAQRLATSLRAVAPRVGRPPKATETTAPAEAKKRGRKKKYPVETNTLQIAEQADAGLPRGGHQLDPVDGDMLDALAAIG